MQMDDVLPQMAHWKPGPQHIERAPFLGLPCRECFIFPVDMTGESCAVFFLYAAVPERPVRPFSPLPARIDP